MKKNFGCRPGGFQKKCVRTSCFSSHFAAAHSLLMSNWVFLKGLLSSFLFFELERNSRLQLWGHSVNPRVWFQTQGHPSGSRHARRNDWKYSVQKCLKVWSWLHFLSVIEDCSAHHILFLDRFHSSLRIPAGWRGKSPLVSNDRRGWRSKFHNVASKADFIAVFWTISTWGDRLRCLVHEFYPKPFRWRFVLFSLCNLRKKSSSLDALIVFVMMNRMGRGCFAVPVLLITHSKLHWPEVCGSYRYFQRSGPKPVPVRFVVSDPKTHVAKALIDFSNVTIHLPDRSLFIHPLRTDCHVRAPPPKE